jgi:tol-pal system protein YbgF
MKKLICVAAVLLTSACASSQDDDAANVPSLVPPAGMAMPAAETAAAPDARISELQTQLTELLERIDVLNQRIAQLEEAPAPAAPQVVSQPAPRPAQPAAPQVTTPVPAPRQRALAGADLAEEYRQAIILFGRGRHAEARRAFQDVYESDNSGDLADNALFWIGETYFAAKDYTNAVRYYMRVVNDYSSQNKAPDALFKTAMVQSRTGDLALARRTLQQVIERYPYSSSASSAKAELERIKF